MTLCRDHNCVTAILLHVLLFGASVIAQDQLSPANQCLMQMSNDENCVKEVIGGGHAPKRYDDPGCGACDNSKDEYCAQKVQNGEIVSSAPPTCEKLPPSCLGPCRSGGSGGGGQVGPTPSPNGGSTTPSSSRLSTQGSTRSSSSHTNTGFSSSNRPTGFSTNRPTGFTNTGETFGPQSPGTRPVTTFSPVTRTQSPPIVGAQDRHPYCCFWAQAGECNTNGGWMSRNCPESCGQAGQEVASSRIQGCAFRFTGMQNTRPFSEAEYLQTLNQAPPRPG